MQEISRATLNRLPAYLRCLYELEKKGVSTVSSTQIAAALDLNPVQVRKDVAYVSTVAGKPKTGYVLKELIADFENFLGYRNSRDAILVGAGGLGRAILGYDGFAKYGLNIVAAFDIDEKVVNTTINSKPVYEMSKLKSVVERFNIRLGIITVPSQSAQEVADVMVDAGILAIWSFSAKHLNLPPGIALKHEDLAASLALLRMELISQDE